MLNEQLNSEESNYGIMFVKDTNIWISLIAQWDHQKHIKTNKNGRNM